MKKRRLVFVIVAVLLVPVLGLVLWTKASLWYVYSNGERAGFLQKLSHKGWLCKTWEGELALQNFPGGAPEIFRFSVRSDAVATQLQTLEGEKVALIYEQHVGIPSSCFGETQYFITGVRRVGQ